MKTKLLSAIVLVATMAMTMNAANLTVAEAIERGMALDSMATDTVEVTVDGYALNVGPYSLYYDNQTYYMADDATNTGRQEFEAYQCIAKSGNDTVRVLPGDKVALTGKLYKYYDKKAKKFVIEMSKGVATIVEATTGDRAVDRTVNEVSIDSALAIGKKLASGDQTPVNYAIEGYVVGFINDKNNTYTDGGFAKYGDQCVWIAPTADGIADKDHAFQIYRGVAKVEGEAFELQKGDKVRIVCQIKNYSGTIESADTKLPVEVIEAQKRDTVSVTEAAQIAFALEDNAISEKKYAVIGYVRKVKTEYSAQYGNETFYIVDQYPAEEGAVDIQCYRAKIASPGCAVGDRVIVVGKFKNNVYEGNHTAELVEGSEAEVIDRVYVTTNVSPASTGSCAVTYGWQSCKITATPCHGYHFVRWSDGNTDNPRTIELTKDTTLEAIFSHNPVVTRVFNPIMGTVDGDTITPTGLAEADVSITANAKYGYHFVQWSDGVTTATRTIHLTRDTTMEAIFAPNKYSILVTCDNTQGTVEGESGSFDYLAEKTYKAIPSYGYHFVCWSDNVTQNPRTYAVTADATLSAIFTRNTYNIIKDVEHGNISGKNTAEYLEYVTLTVTPDYGYHFTQWSDGLKDNPRIFRITQDTTFMAEFALDVTGSCGRDNLLTWRFDSVSHTLAISGEGVLNCNYTFGVQAPVLTERLVIEEGVTSIGTKAFYNMCSNITSLAFPSTLTAIGDYAFAGLNSRKFNSLVLPSKIVYIGAHAFDGALYLQTIHFGSALEEIGIGAFNGCTRVKEMTCMAEITPNVGTDALTSINSLAKLYVPEDYLFDYQIDNNWNRFQLQTIGATGTTITENEVAISANDNTATFTWPTDNSAATYTIEITKDGVVFCTLCFNANGQLTGIAFAPSRDGKSRTPAAIMTASGMQFTVTGLNSGTNYAFSLTAKDAQNTVVASYTGQFTTTGAAPVATNLINVQSDDVQCTKVIRDGQLFILRGDKTYTIQGQEVR